MRNECNLEDLITHEQSTITLCRTAGVPSGTEGKVVLSNGFNWMRYRVQFTNGVELGDLDHRHLVPARRAAKRAAKAAKRA